MATSMLRPSGKIEIMLHTACVRAGAFAIAHGIIDRFPLAKPFLAKPVMQSLAKKQSASHPEAADQGHLQATWPETGQLGKFRHHRRHRKQLRAARRFQATGTET